MNYKRPFELEWKLCTSELLQVKAIKSVKSFDLSFWIYTNFGKDQI